MQSLLRLPCIVVICNIIIYFDIPNDKDLIEVTDSVREKYPRDKKETESWVRLTIEERDFPKQVIVIVKVLKKLSYVYYCLYIFSLIISRDQLNDNYKMQAQLLLILDIST